MDDLDFFGFGFPDFEESLVRTPGKKNQPTFATNNTQNYHCAYQMRTISFITAYLLSFGNRISILTLLAKTTEIAVSE